MSVRKGNILISGSGRDGIDGIDGTNGRDGISPNASVSKVAGTSTFTVTDANGTSSVAILDGSVMQTYELSGIEEYSNQETYNKNDYVGYNDYIYKCNSTILTPEEWTPAHWTQKTYLDYLNDIIVGNALESEY